MHIARSVELSQQHINLLSLRILIKLQRRPQKRLINYLLSTLAWCKLIKFIIKQLNRHLKRRVTSPHVAINHYLTSSHLSNYICWSEMYELLIHSPFVHSYTHMYIYYIQKLHLLQKFFFYSLILSLFPRLIYVTFS